jgi:hypothetical protein
MPNMSTSSDHVIGAFNYIASSEARPAYYLYPVDRSEIKPLPERQKCRMPVYDCRSDMADFDLDVAGFAFADFKPDCDDFYDSALVKRDYYPQVAALVKQQTGASRVVVFDHNVRHDPTAQKSTSDAARPVRFVHNDYTEKSGPQRVKDILGEAEAAPLLQHRFAVINVWRPISGPVLDMPLGILDARSVAQNDFVATDLKYRDRTGEVTSLRHNPDHRWNYLSAMQADEVLFLKCFDNDTSGLARYTGHSAFSDPTTPPDAPARESIEARTLVFFAP